jgi:class 3 adenylate cyclase/cold shock CspA family protein
MPENTQLREAFASPQSRTDRTVIVVDVIDSTAMKEHQPEVTWLNSLGWMYDVVTEIATSAVPDVLVKYLGDGIMLVVGTDHTTDAVNLAIRVQEAITEAGKGSGGAKGVIDFTCSVGISTGEVVGFTTPSGSPDYVGAVVDKAFRLCSHANAQAIFVDTATVGAANTMRIASEFGKVIKRTSDQYTGEVQKALLKGFREPIGYMELLWGQQLYGVKSASVTASTDRLRPTPTTNPIPAHTLPTNRPTGKAERHHGAVTYWNADKGFGFVRDPRAGEEFHFTVRLLAYPEDAEKLTENKEVAFVAIDAQPGRKNRQATAVLLLGEPAEGPLVALRPDKSCGWILVEDKLRHGHPVYAPISELQGRKVGDLLGFTVKANDKGSYADQIELAEDDQAA